MRKMHCYILPGPLSRGFVLRGCFSYKIWEDGSQDHCMKPFLAMMSPYGEVLVHIYLALRIDILLQRALALDSFCIIWLFQQLTQDYELLPRQLWRVFGHSPWRSLLFYLIYLKR